MKIDVREILFIKQNAPIGMIRMLANNVDLPYQKVRNELMTLKEDYEEKIIVEARRLLVETTGLIYKEEIPA